MTNEIVAFARRRAAMAVRRAAFPAAFALTGGFFVLIAVVGLFAALFFWLEPWRGPLAASLIVAAVALALGLLALLPLAFRRRPKPSPEAALPQFVSLMARSAPSLAPRHVIMTGLLLALALGLTAGGSAERKK